MSKKQFYSWIPVLAWCSLIFYLSSIPNLKIWHGLLDYILRKCAHMAVYGILFLLSRRAFSDSFKGWTNNKVFIVSAVFSVLYAASDEFHQAFVPMRGPSVIDVGIDSAGVAAGYLVYGYLQRITERKNAI